MATLDARLAATLIGAFSALVGVPLTAIVFYLRAIREEQRTQQASLGRRMECVEAECRRIDRAVCSVERNYTSKADWDREIGLARRQLARLGEMLARLQAEMESSQGLAAQFVRTTNAVIGLTETLSKRLANPEDPRGAA